MKKEFLEAGKIVSTHGIRGEVKIMPYTDSPELLCEFDRLFYGRNKDELVIERSRPAKNMVIAKIEGVNTVEEAEKLRNTMLYMHRDDLELDENTFFIQDLIGMEVRDADTDFVYGKVTDVLQNGANDVYVIKGNREYLVPAIPDVIISTDIDGELMTIRPLELSDFCRKFVKKSGFQKCAKPYWARALWEEQERQERSTFPAARYVNIPRISTAGWTIRPTAAAWEW